MLLNLLFRSWSHRGRPLCFGLVCVLVITGCDGEDLSAPTPPNLDRLDPALAEAIEAQLRQVHANPQSSERRRKLGALYASNSLYQSAHRAFEQAVQIASDDAKAWYFLAQTHAEQGDLQSALEAMARSLRLSPEYAPGFAQRARWWLQSGRLQDARQDFQRALEIAPSSAAGRLGLARISLQQNQPEEVIRRLENQKWDRDDIRRHAHQLLGRAYARMGREAEALAQLKEAPKSPPAWVDPWKAELESFRFGFRAQMDRAKNHFDQGQYEQSARLLKNLSAHPEAGVEVPTNLGLSYLMLNRRREAIQVLERAIQVNDQSLLAQYTLAGALWNECQVTQQNELGNRALFHLTQALKIQNTHAPSHGLKGEILTAAGQLTLAIASYEDAWRWDKQNAEWPIRLADSHASQSKWLDAIPLYVEAAKLSPAPGPIYGKLALAYLALEDLAQATQAIDDAAKHLGNDDARVKQTRERIKERKNQ